MHYLDKSDTRLKLALQVTNSGMWEWNILTAQITWSENFELLFGVSPGTLKETYRGLLDRILPTDRSSVLRAIANAIREQANYTIKFRISHSDGSIRWLVSQGEVYGDKNSHPVRITGVCRDITGDLKTDSINENIQQSNESLFSHSAASSVSTQHPAPSNFDREVDHHALQQANQVLEARLQERTAAFEQVVEQLRIEIAKREQAQRFAARLITILERTPDAVGITDTAGRPLYLNRTARMMFGVDEAQELSADRLKACAVLSMQKSIMTEGMPVALQEGIWSGETILQQQSGKEIPISQVIMSHKSESGEVEFISTIARDITPAKQAEAALARSEAKWRSLIQNSSDLITILSQDGTLLYTSPSIERILGYSPKELVGQSVLDYIATQDLEAIAKALDDLLAAGHGVTLPPIIFRFRCKNESWCYLEASGTNLLADEAVGGIVINSRDLTERFKVQEALRQSEVRFRAIFEGAALGIALTDPTGELLTGNPALHKMFGYTEQELRERTITHPDDAAADSRLYEQLLAGSIPSYQMEKRYFHKNGYLVWGRLTVSLVRDKAKNPLFAVTMVEDITAAKQTEAELLRISKAVENASDAISIADTFGATLSYLNPAFCQMFEYTLEELNAVGGAGILFSEPEIMHQVFAIAIGGHSWQGEVEMLSKSGSRKQIALRTDAIKDVMGEVVGTIAIHTDITERKQAEAALRRSYHRVELLKQITTEIRSSLDLEHIFQTTVTQLGQALQVNRCMIYLYQGVPQPSLPLVAEYLEPGYSSLQYFRVPVQGNAHAERVLATDQAIAYVDVYNEPLLEDNWELCRAMQIKSLVWIRTSYQGQPNGVIGLHQCDFYRNWRASEIELVEAVAAQVGIALAQAHLLEKERCTAAQLALRNTALQLSEARANTKASELEQALRELQRTQAQLVQTEKMSSLGQLIAGVAHEINNPVSFITGNISYACDYIEDLLAVVNLYQQYYPQPVEVIQAELEEIDLDFVIKDFPKLLSSIKVGADRVNQIVLSLRNFSRHDEAEMKPVDIHEGIDNTLMILQSRLKAKGGSSEIKVIKNYGELPQIECYAGQLNQVFMNLISNAIDALESSGVGSNGVTSPSPLDQVNSDSKLTACDTWCCQNSSPTPTITICTEVKANNRAVIHIMDNGVGMTEEVQKKLFNPFFTTKPVGKGTGLGLSISYQIVVEKHSGELQCFSTPGQGTEFIIDIPIQHNYETQV